MLVHFQFCCAGLNGHILAALCTEPGLRAAFTLSVLPKLPCGTKVYLADPRTNNSVHNFIFSYNI